MFLLVPQPGEVVVTSFISRVVIIFFRLVCCAQEVAPAGVTLKGVVEDKTGAVVPGAKLTLTNKQTAAEIKAKPDETGSFTFEAVPSGKYELKVKAENFSTIEVPVNIGKAAPQPVRVRMELKGKREEVTVHCAKPVGCRNCP